MRYNHKDPLPHYDPNKYAFLLYLKGEPLLNNGTGFYNDEGNLYHHIGFMENTALFFNASKILHTGLQSFGESSPRYCINLFFVHTQDYYILFYTVTTHSIIQFNLSSRSFAKKC